MDVAVYYFPFGDRQPFLLVRQEKLRYHPKRAEQIDETQPIDDFLSLPYREPFTPMAKPQMKAQIVTRE